jgi:hypothetical protein
LDEQPLFRTLFLRWPVFGRFSHEWASRKTQAHWCLVRYEEAVDAAVARAIEPS